VDGIPTYLHGCNYPWTKSRDGKSNYGLDFGLNLWRTHEGVSTRRNIVRKDLEEMNSLGLNVVRWFVFCDGRGGIQFDEDMVPRTLAEGFWEDMDCALAVAEEMDIRIVFVLFDHSWLFNEIREAESGALVLKGQARAFTTSEGQDALLKRVCIPIFEHYGTHPRVLAWEVMNEPDYAVRGLDCAPRARDSGMSLAALVRFVSLFAESVHKYTTSMVTVGGGRVKHARLWDDPSMQLDFVQVHAYNDFIRAWWDDVLYGRAVGDLKLSKPCVIGEFPADHSSFRVLAERLSPGAVTVPELGLNAYLDFALDAGYAGAWYWSFNSVDRCGGPDKNVLRAWCERRAADLRPRSVPPIA
jgi:hypothetical protein